MPVRVTASRSTDWPDPHGLGINAFAWTCHAQTVNNSLAETASCTDNGTSEPMANASARQTGWNDINKLYIDTRDWTVSAQTIYNDPTCDTTPFSTSNLGWDDLSGMRIGTWDWTHAAQTMYGKPFAPQTLDDSINASPLYGSTTNPDTSATPDSRRLDDHVFHANPKDITQLLQMLTSIGDATQCMSNGSDGTRM